MEYGLMTIAEQVEVDVIESAVPGLHDCRDYDAINAEAVRGVST